MAINSNSGMPVGCFARMGHFLMTLVASKDLHVRQVIARAASQARPGLRPDSGLEFKARWRAGHDLATRLRAE